MRRPALLLVAALLAMLVNATPASASFGFEDVDVTFTNKDGSPATQAGSHPFAMTSTLDFNMVIDPKLGEVPDEAVKDLIVDLPPGFVADPTAVPRCSNADFAAPFEESKYFCPDASAVGFVAARKPGATVPGDFAAVYNLTPPPGVAAKFGFHVLGVTITIEGGVRPEGKHNVFASLTNLPQAAAVAGSELTLWANPADPTHDDQRGNCVFPPEGDKCPVESLDRPFTTLPRSCTGPLRTVFQGDSWDNPGVWARAEAESHDNAEPPNPLGLLSCEKVGFSPQVMSQPTTDEAESPTGLDFDVDIHDAGLTSPTGIAQSDIRKAVVTLPAGVTINPSVAEGLAACSPLQLKEEAIDSEPGEGCPQASKVGTVEVQTPLLEETLMGAVYVATQDDPATAKPGAENPFDSMIALYMVIKNPERGILVKLAGKVEPGEEHGPRAGQLVTSFDDIPQFPFNHFHFHFREGGRSPLITPAQCGAFTTEAVFTPWANPSQPLTTTSSFQITRGTGGGACPPGGPRPFAPGFTAGSLNNSAGAYSPFYMRLTRQDGEQEMTRFSSVLPPGVTGRLVGVSRCPDAAIAAAKTRSGHAEAAGPSCPAASQIGRTVAAAGVGSQLTYVPGKLYLAGPIGGDPLSVVGIVPAVAGPFDAGTVVVREALTLNPVTAEVEVDGAHSDPFPHILKGIVLKLRELEVYVDRPDFILNPTSCAARQARATLFGSFVDVFDPADDVPAQLADRFQAASCASLGFKPKLMLRLQGGTKRGSHPALTAIAKPRLGDANFSQAIVTLPRSAFLDQSHIRTICTRVQYAAHACPAGSIYGYANAITPLLEEPLAGPVYLRSSSHNLPDLVVALHGIVDIELTGRLDSHKGGIRSTFEHIPDAPVTSFTLHMQGGKKGLIVNSRDVCARRSRATARLLGQNGRRYASQPRVRSVCKR